MEVKENIINVDIRAVELNGKPFTSRLFFQLHEEDAFDKNWDFIGHKILGYVKYDNKNWAVFLNQEEQLRKSQINPDSDFRIVLPSLDKAPPGELTYQEKKDAIAEEIKKMQIFI